MPRLVNAAFFNVSSERQNRLLFVGITRAAKWVYLSTIQYGKDAKSTGQGVLSEKEDDDLLDIL